MAVLDEYILRAARLLSDAADEDVDALCREIMQVFDLDYTNPEALKYINSSSSFRYSKSDLGMILQKLRLKREDSDDKAFGAAFCATITQHIRRLEQALEGGFCSRARLKISKGQVVFFEKITQKISTFKPLPIFILSVLSSLSKARLSKNKIFIVFRFSSVTDKTTQNKKDTREVSRIFYSAIAPFNGTKRFEFLL